MNLNSSSSSSNLETILKLFVNSNDSVLKEKYVQAALKHNEMVQGQYPDAGFDLFVPEEFSLSSSKSLEKVNLCVKTAMFHNNKPVSYYTYPRSSIYKTQLRLANSVGIIDSGYRGNLMSMLDNYGNLENKEMIIEQYQRLIQLCSPNLSAFTVHIVDNEAELGMTERGEGGFGSTGL